MIGLIRWPHNSRGGEGRRGRPYVYSPTIILRCFVVRIWFRLDSHRALHEYLAMDLSYNRKVMKRCGLSRVPSRRTFDRRLVAISEDIKNRITAMGELFVRDTLVDPCIVSTDITLIKAKGFVWHKSSMKKGVVPRSGIDTDARWGFSHTKRWIFGYKLHLISSTSGSVIISLAADFTTANITDNQIYSILTASLPVTITRRTLFMSADPGYNDHKLYHLSNNIRFRLVSPLQQYKNTSVDRIDTLPVRGDNKACASVLLSVLLYQILVYYNCKTKKENPRAIKYMLGT